MIKVKFDFSSPFEGRWYKTLRPAVRGLVSLKFKIRSFGEENIPKQGAFILAANHIYAFDPLMIISHCPRTLHFMAKEELFKNPVFGAFLKSMNAFPVKRQKSDKRALEYAKRIISLGWVLGIFPEGSRSKDALPKTAKNGVSYIAAKTGADVLPVSIYKTPGDTRRRPHITIRFGKLIKNSELAFSKEYSSQNLKLASESIMEKIVELWSMKHGEQ